MPELGGRDGMTHKAMREKLIKFEEEARAKALKTVKVWGPVPPDPVFYATPTEILRHELYTRVRRLYGV